MARAGMNGKKAGTPEKEIIAELRLNRNQVPEIREKHLCTEDWWRAENERGKPVMLTDEGVTKYRIYAAAIKTEPQIVPTFIGYNGRPTAPPTKEKPWVTVWDKYPNPNYAKVRIKIDYGEHGHILADHVPVPKKLIRFMERDKHVRVEVVRGATEVAYRHEALATNY